MNRNVVEHYRQNRLEGWLVKYCGKGPLGEWKVHAKTAESSYRIQLLDSNCE